MIETQEIEAKIVKKYDLRVLPLVTLMYLCGFLIRVNIANVQTEIMEDLKVSDITYGWFITAFFIGYTLFEVPSNLMLKKYTARRWFPMIMTIWGILACASAFSNSALTLWIFRLCVGTLEAGIYPGILYFLSFWYLKSERGLRYSIFFAAALVSSSFSGLLAYIILQLDGFLGYEGWRWVFFIEGLPSIIFAPLLYLFLPKDPASVPWLSEREKSIAVNRMKIPSSTNDFDGDEIMDETSFLNSPIEKEFIVENKLDAFKNPAVWLFSFLYLTACTPVAAISAFLPKIVQLLGYDTLYSNLITVPLYLIAAVFVLTLSRSSDRKNERPFHLLCSIIIGIIGFAGLSFLKGNNWVYIGLSLLFVQLAIIGSAGCIPLISVWLTSTIPQDRPLLLAISSGTMATVGQISGIVTPLIYVWLSIKPENDINGSKLDYTYAHFVMVCVMCASCVLTLSLRRFLQRQLFVRLP